MTYSISGPFYWFGLFYRTAMYIGLVKARYDQIKMIRCRAWFSTNPLSPKGHGAI
jgi:hypothetical protein